MQLEVHRSGLRPVSVARARGQTPNNLDCNHDLQVERCQPD